MPMKSKSLTIIDTDILNTEAARNGVNLLEGDEIPLETVGDTLRLDFMEPLGLTGYRIAKDIGVPQTYISKLIHGANLSIELGLMLDRYFGMSEGWFNRLQASIDSLKTKRRIKERLDKIQPYNRAA